MKNKGIFSQKLRSLRRKTHMTQEILAERLGVSRSKVANWEAGIRLPNRADLESLSLIFGVPADYFYGMGERKDYFDLTKINSEGIQLMKAVYELIINSDKYTKH